jgi:hypothetical protein
MARTLLATPDAFVPGSSLSDVGDVLAVDVLTGQASLDALLASGAKYSSARVVGTTTLSPAFLGGVAKLLQPGARVEVAAGAASQVRARCSRCFGRMPPPAWMLPAACFALMGCPA